MCVPVFLQSLHIGKVALLADQKTQSAIDKTMVDGPLHLRVTGFEGDNQADKRHHGGLEKAVHHYAFDHYQSWRQQLGDIPILQKAGAFGENFSTLGVTEKNVAVGDRFRLGTALIEVSQGRQPCFKLNQRFNERSMSRLVQQSGRTGWYYRVIEEGIVSPCDQFELVDRVAPQWTIWKIWHYFYEDRFNREALAALAALDVLSSSWRSIAQKRIESNDLEDWSRRLDGH